MVVTFRLKPRRMSNVSFHRFGVGFVSSLVRKQKQPEFSSILHPPIPRILLSCRFSGRVSGESPPASGTSGCGSAPVHSG